ncbi:MAG: DegT/DnrJ/EryC1/StrS family aminotransferase [Candidatus Altiarchaeota archaeon]
MAKEIILVSEPWIGDKEKELVNQALDEGWVSSIGRFILEFEEKFAKFCSVKHGLAVSNGTVALHLALEALGIESGDEVLIPSLTFIATANAVHYTGAKPVCVDSEPETWNLDVEDLRKKITSKTKAIVPVHLYGHPCEMDEILEVAEENDLLVVEDCAEAHGAEYKKKKVGSFGDAGVFSFYANKVITTGEGGAIVTDDDELFEKMHFLRDHAMSKDKRYFHPEIGYNYRMTNLQAALGVAQMERIDEFIENKRKNAQLYNSLLKDTKGITLPPEKSHVKNVYWMYSILIEDEFPLTKDELMKELKEKGIDTRPFFIPINLQPPYKGQPVCRVAEEISSKGMSLPSSTKLTKEQIFGIADVINSGH